MLSAMAIEIREIRDDDFEAVAAILDGSYGPGPGRVARVRRYRSLERETWLLALADGEPAGMAGALDYGAFGYVGLVGVLPRMQRRGIALTLMDRLLALLDARGRRTVLLDASDAGAPLYRRLGFVDDDTTRIFAAPAPRPAASAARPMARDDLAEVAELDRRVGGADRARLLAIYFDEYAGRAFVAEDARGRVAGFALAQAHTVGPWVAADDAAAESALDAALACPFEGAVTVAVPGANGAAAALLEARGFAFARSLAHMRLGPAVARRRDRIYGQASLAAG
jgi:GNAT superfamily N-acetyltransferase